MSLKSTTDIASLPTAPGVDHSSWRLAIARRIAAEIDPGRFGVRAVYVFGSTKNATAGPGSDIDLLIHLERESAGRRELEVWLEGWSLCIAEINRLCTGYHSIGLLDVHLITDKDIALHTSYAIKIGAVTDAAEPLPLGPRAPGRGSDQRIRERDRFGLFDG